MWRAVSFLSAPSLLVIVVTLSISAASATPNIMGDPPASLNMDVPISAALDDRRPNLRFPRVHEAVRAFANDSDAFAAWEDQRERKTFRMGVITCLKALEEVEETASFKYFEHCLYSKFVKMVRMSESGNCPPTASTAPLTRTGTSDKPKDPAVAAPITVYKLPEAIRPASFEISERSSDQQPDDFPILFPASSGPYSRRAKRQLHHHQISRGARSEKQGEAKEGREEKEGGKKRFLNGVEIIERRRLKEKGLWGRR